MGWYTEDHWRDALQARRDNRDDDQEPAGEDPDTAYEIRRDEQVGATTTALLRRPA